MKASDWVISTAIVFPQDANPLGNMFGGRVMQMMDMNSAIACFRFSRTIVVTASSEPIDFRAPVNVGDLLEIRSRVVWTGRTSMIVRSEVMSEKPLSGERQLTTIGHMAFVAIDDAGRPIPVPELEIRDSTEQDHHDRGALVREHFLARRAAAP